MAFTRIQIISNALTIIGKGPVNETSSIGPIGAAAEQSYDRIYPTLLSTDNWRFNVRLQELSRDVETPIIQNWRYIYQLPADYLQLIRLYPLNKYQIYEDKVFSNAQKVTAEYRFLCTEANLPAYFVDYLVYALAEDIALAIALQQSYAAEMREKKKLAYAKGLAADGYSHPNTAIVDSPLVQVRFGNINNRYGYGYRG